MGKISTKYQSIRIYVVLAVITFVAFGQVLRSDFVDYDDDLYVTENANVKAGLTRET